MRRFTHFFNAVIRLWRRFRGVRPEDMPRLLPPEVLAQALREAQFLRERGVDVRYLTPGEEPGAPRPAGGSEPPPTA